MKLKICFLAPSGYGKSTASEILEKKYNAKVVKIGAPLYELQSEFYKKLGINIGDTQDGELLGFLGKKVRKESPNYLLETFASTLANVENTCDMIINDDCRPADYEFLKNLGFIFVKINGFSRERCDHTKCDKTSSLEWQNEIPFDYEMNNFNNLNEYVKEVTDLISKIKNENYSLALRGTKY